MADVTVKWSLSEANEVKQVLTEILGTRAQVLDSAAMKREYLNREGGRQEWETLQQRFMVLENAVRKLG